ncbi:hypothetical protein GCM10023194_21800 [Planotetraspora phitsanulokensis]|uniref:OmpR/PhoB-type domain-containing protein n=1 Tax=Planotetraspora phitsanulokensis TaxID=575192 RepID=A0A8J3U573_9ACTN|nr:winged helix-turn-helix domain-containing protein [Planotetraspora phitsanulokensis]GII38237.1 hypothetical protein Pph01_32400 [Planotetraspora phitsanulokensis]
MSHVMDFVAHQREPGHDPAPADEGTVLGVLPMPGADAALVIVGYMVPLDGGSPSVEGLRPPRGAGLPDGRAARAPQDTARAALDAVRAAQDTARAPQDTAPSDEIAPVPAPAHPGRGDHVSRQGRAPAPVEDLVVDRASRAVRVDGVEIELTYREFELLDYLCSAPGRVFNRRQLMSAIWDRYGDEGARTVDVHVLRLRRKLGPHAGRIVTVRNVGYKYQPARLRRS